MVRLSVVLLSALTLVCGTAVADAPPPFRDFSAKRVKPPQPGAKRLITVQIEPEVQASSASVPKSDIETTPERPNTRFDWFWQNVSPEMTEAGPGRLDQALRALAQAEQPVPVPRLQQMQTLAQEQGVEILKATIGTDVSPALVLAVMMVESAGKVEALSSAGAQGLMQLMPDTAARFGVRDSFVPAENIAGGVKYLDWLMDTFARDPVLVLAGYNAGEGSVRHHEGVPPFAEARDYVPKVLATFQVAKGLCVTHPELVTDGCVFAALN